MIFLLLQGKLLDGALIKGESLVNQLELLNNRNDFNLLVQNMKDYYDFKVNELEVKKAYEFDAIIGKKEDLRLFSSKILYLKSKDNRLSLLFNELPSTQDHILGRILIKNGAHNFIKQFLYKNGHIEIKDIPINFEQLPERNDEEELPNNPKYVAGQSFNDA